MLPGAKKVFRLEAELEASPEELHHILFVKVEEMNAWNPSIGGIKVSYDCLNDMPNALHVREKKAGNYIPDSD